MPRAGGWRAAAAALLLLLLLLCLALRSPGEAPGPGPTAGLHWMGFTGREARLAERLREAEATDRWLRLQLAASQARAGRALARRPGPAPGCQPAAEPCEPVHVAIVCAGITASRTVVTLLKSILFHRRHPITFHLLSDLAGRRVLTRLAATWRLPAVNFRFYNTEQAVGDVAWIPNKHYSGVYGLLKLTLPKILPPDLDKVIVLDTDVTFATDIGRLWAVFQAFRPGQALGLVENQSDWYIPGKLWKNHRPWPALGRGFNTGVILMELARLRAAGWSQTWRMVAETDLVTMLSTSLADQDIFNAVVHRHPDLLHRLPCQWNVQLSDNSLSDTLCYNKLTADSVNVIHFNSPKKILSENRHINFFRNLHLTFLQYDGNLLRRELYNCLSAAGEEEADKEAAAVTEVPVDDGCQGFRASGSTVYRTHLNFLPDCQPADNNTANKGETTLVAQLSMDRLHMLRPLLARWPGPASLALYLSDPEAAQLVSFFESSPGLTDRCNVGYHVVYKEGDYYPINFLRNLALDNAVTEYVFLSDIDFLPSEQIVPSLLASTAALLADRPRRALVVPAFESQRYRLHRFPSSKAEVVKRLDLGELFTFRHHDWPAGHDATNFPRWRSSTQPYAVEWQDAFEPYIVARRDAVPRYDTRFVGFGWNKVSHMLALAAAGWELVVLPDVFLVHLPHAPSQEIGRFREEAQYRRCLDSLKGEYSRELRERGPGGGA